MKQSDYLGARGWLLFAITVVGCAYWAYVFSFPRYSPEGSRIALWFVYTLVPIALLYVFELVLAIKCFIVKRRVYRVDLISSWHAADAFVALVHSAIILALTVWSFGSTGALYVLAVTAVLAGVFPTRLVEKVKYKPKLKFFKFRKGKAQGDILPQVTYKKEAKRMNTIEKTIEKATIWGPLMIFLSPILAPVLGISMIVETIGRYRVHPKKR